MGGGTMKRLWSVMGFALAVALSIVAAVGPLASAQEDAGGAQTSEPVTMTIMDDDAVMLITKVDGRDVVRVFGRTRVDHGSRSVWADELEYDEEASRAVMTGAVELVDEGDDGLNLTAQFLQLDLNTEAATATGDVSFRRGEAEGVADELYYGEFEELQAVVDAALAARSEAVRRAVLETLSSFLADDKVLVLQGRVDMKDGEREFQSEFVIVNTRDDAMVSLGRSAARLPGPESDD